MAALTSGRARSLLIRTRDHNVWENHRVEKYQLSPKQVKSRWINTFEVD